MSTTDYLSALNYGTSTGGSAGAAETASTVGTARLDVREPPDQYRISGLQITRLVELAVAISSDLKGGTRVRMRKQTANPFGASESGFYISTAGTAYKVVDGTPTALAGGGGGDMVLADVQTVSGAKSFNDATLKQFNAGATFATTFASAATANRVWTLPDATDTAVGLAAAQTLTTKTLTAPVINGATSASGNFDLSGSTGTFKTTTGASTFGGSSNTFTNAITVGVSVASSTTTLELANSNSNDTLQLVDGGSVPQLRSKATTGTYVRFDTNLTWGSAGGFLLAASDLGQAIGSSANRLTMVWAQRHYGVQQTVTSSGAISIVPTSGETYRLLANGNVTSISIGTGTYNGEVITLILVQDAAGTSTWATTITNATLAGGSFTKTAAANAVDTLTFRYDATSTLWREMSRSLTQS